MQLRSFPSIFSFEGTGKPFVMIFKTYKIFSCSHKDPLVDDDYKNIDLIEEAVTVLQENLVKIFHLHLCWGFISSASTTLFASSQLDKNDILSVTKSFRTWKFTFSIGLIVKCQILTNMGLTGKFPPTHRILCIIFDFTLISIQHRCSEIPPHQSWNLAYVRGNLSM